MTSHVCVGAAVYIYIRAETINRDIRVTRIIFLLEEFSMPRVIALFLNSGKACGGEMCSTGNVFTVAQRASVTRGNTSRVYHSTTAKPGRRSAAPSRRAAAIKRPAAPLRNRSETARRSNDAWPTAGSVVRRSHDHACYTPRARRVDTRPGMRAPRDRSALS